MCNKINEERWKHNAHRKENFDPFRLYRLLISLHSRQFAFKFWFFDVVSTRKGAERNCLMEFKQTHHFRKHQGWVFLFFFVRCNLRTDTTPSENTRNSHPVTFVPENCICTTPNTHQTPICSFRLIASRNGNVAKIILDFSEAIWEMDGMFVRGCL